MKRDDVEQKVEKVFKNPANNRVEAVLYRMVDSIGVTPGYMLHLVFSGKKIFHTDMKALLKHTPVFSR